MTHALKFPQKRFSFVSNKNPKVITASLEPTFTLNFLAWDFLDLITSLNVHWTIKPRSQVTNSWRKTQGPGLLSPVLIQRFFSSSFFHWRYSLLNIQVLCKSLSSHYKALQVSIFHLLCLVTWAINSNSLNTVTYTPLFRETSKLAVCLPCWLLLHFWQQKPALCFMLSSHIFSYLLTEYLQVILVCHTAKKYLCSFYMYKWYQIWLLTSKVSANIYLRVWLTIFTILT